MPQYDVSHMVQNWVALPPTALLWVVGRRAERSSSQGTIRRMKPTTLRVVKYGDKSHDATVLCAVRGQLQARDWPQATPSES